MSLQRSEHGDWENKREHLQESPRKKDNDEDEMTRDAGGKSGILQFAESHVAYDGAVDGERYGEKRTDDSDGEEDIQFVPLTSDVELKSSLRQVFDEADYENDDVVSESKGRFLVDIDGDLCA